MEHRVADFRQRFERSQPEGVFAPAIHTDGHECRRRASGDLRICRGEMRPNGGDGGFGDGKVRRAQLRDGGLQRSRLGETRECREHRNLAFG